MTNWKKEHETLSDAFQKLSKECDELVKKRAEVVQLKELLEKVYDNPQGYAILKRYKTEQEIEQLLKSKG